MTTQLVADRRDVFTPAVYDAWRPCAVVSVGDWIADNVYGHERHLRRKIDPAHVPQLFAAGGPYEAFDDNNVRFIYLMWGSRLAKTLFALSLQVAIAATMPRPMLLASATNDLVKRQTAKLYTMLERTEATRTKLKSQRLRKQTEIDLAGCMINTAWSGSTTSLADLAAWFAHCNELEKYSTDESDEGDPFKLALERTKEFAATRKVVGEGTPARKGHSRIERAFLTGDQRRYHVPCPHCGAFQPLVLGTGKEDEAGVVWDKTPEGHLDANLAYATARYRCGKCLKDIEDEHRPPMMRSGVWAPEHCHVTKAARVVGGGTFGAIASYHLSTLYSLDVGWGDIAQEFINCHGQPGEWQNFLNSWLGETYAFHRQHQTWRELGQRLAGSYHLGTLPADAIFLTAGVDVQIDHWVFWIEAFGLLKRGWLVDYGIADSFEELWEEHIDRAYAAAEGARALKPRLTLVDSGHDTDTVYDLCRQYNRRGQFVVPLKGGNSTQGEPYRQVQIGKTPATRKRRTLNVSPGRQWLVHLHTNYWQEVLQRRLDTLSPSDPGGLSIPLEAAEDEDLLSQLLNETHDEEKGQWVPVQEHLPVDFRDTARYARAAAEIVVSRAWNRLRPQSFAPPAATKQNDNERSEGGVRRRKLERRKLERR